MSHKLPIVAEMLEICGRHKDGRVLVHFDARVALAHAPPVKSHNRWNFVVGLSLRNNAPMVIDDFGITACLLFEGQYEIVRAPWDAVWAIAAADPAVNVADYIDFDCLPPEAKAARDAALVQQQATPAQPAQVQVEAPAALPPNVVPFRRPG